VWQNAILEEEVEFLGASSMEHHGLQTPSSTGNLFDQISEEVNSSPELETVDELAEYMSGSRGSEPAGEIVGEIVPGTTEPVATGGEGEAGRGVEGPADEEAPQAPDDTQGAGDNKPARRSYGEASAVRQPEEENDFSAYRTPGGKAGFLQKKAGNETTADGRQMDAAKEYFHMTITAINLQRLDDGQMMVPHEAAEALYRELNDEEIPLHMWHDWVKLRSCNFDDEELVAPEEVEEEEDESTTPRLRRQLRAAVTGNFHTRIRDFVRGSVSQSPADGVASPPAPASSPFTGEDVARHTLQKRLWSAARDDDVPTINDTLEAGVAVDAAGQDGWAALHHAVDRKALTALQTLLERKADVNLSAIDQQTALHMVAAHGSGNDPATQAAPGARSRAPSTSALSATESESIIQTLIDANALLDHPDNTGCTPLMRAAACGYEEVIATLLHAKADLNKVDFDGLSAVHLAAGRGQVSVIEMLLDANVNIDVKDSRERTPLHHAALVTHP